MFCAQCVKKDILAIIKKCADAEKLVTSMIVSPKQYLIDSKKNSSAIAIKYSKNESITKYPKKMHYARISNAVKRNMINIGIDCGYDEWDIMDAISTNTNQNSRLMQIITEIQDERSR